MDRRQFIRFVPLVALASSAFAQQDEVDPKSPTAIALGYSTDHSRVDTTRWSKKGQDVQGQQRCQTCALFTSTDNAQAQTMATASAVFLLADRWPVTAGVMLGLAVN